jgi:DNA-binding transcriptional ArsR family regulator
MKSLRVPPPSSDILHVLFSSVRAELLRRLFFDPTRELYVRELARLTAFALGTVQQELARLSKAGLVTSRSNGYHRFYRANPRHPIFFNLQQLVLKDANRRLSVSRRKRPRQNWRTRKQRSRREPSLPFHITIGHKTPPLLNSTG